MEAKFGNRLVGKEVESNWECWFFALWWLSVQYLTPRKGSIWRSLESVTFSVPYGVSFQHRGDLGNVQAEAGGRATFRIEDKQLKVWDVIGRSLVVDEGEDDLGRGGHPLSKITGNSGKR